ncbi:putative transporter YutK isoform X2 [Haemaphysalis longicornis]
MDSGESWRRPSDAISAHGPESQQSVATEREPSVAALSASSAASDAADTTQKNFLAQEIEDPYQDGCAIETQPLQPLATSSVPITANGTSEPDDTFALSFTEKKKICRWQRHLPFIAKAAAVLFFHVYLAFGISHTWNTAPDFCSGVKFLTVVTCLAYIVAGGCTVGVLLDWLVSKNVIDVRQAIHDATRTIRKKHRWLRPCLWLLVWTCLISLLVYDSLDDSHRLISLSGILVFIFLGFIFSNNRLRVNWYQVMWGLVLQFLLGLCVLRWSPGRAALQCIADKVTHFLNYTNSGTYFVFGHLASGWNLTAALGTLAALAPAGDAGQNNTNSTSTDVNGNIQSLLPIFTFSALPVMIFFSFFMNILYFYGIMQRIVLMAGRFLQLTVGTTVCESMSAAANVVLGMVSAGHLITASVMSAPAALAYSKLLYPETEESKTKSQNIEMPKSEESNVLEAASNGAVMALLMVGNIVANLVAFLAFIAFLNSMLLWFGSIVGLDFLSLEWMLSKPFTPMAFLMGVPWKDCRVVAELIGLKTFANEFIAYSQLVTITDQLDERSTVIATYALCGFANVGSVGIMLGAMAAMAPSRKAECASMALRSLVGGSVACFLTACVAGSLTP